MYTQKYALYSPSIIARFMEHLSYLAIVLSYSRLFNRACAYIKACTAPYKEDNVIVKIVTILSVLISPHLLIQAPCATYCIEK
jgi:hypothetical protein